MNLGALVATLGVNSSGLIKAQKDMLAFEKKTNAALTRVNAKLATTGAAMKKVGKAMTMYLTLPMALVGGAAAKMYMGFEASMSKIVGLVGVAREKVAAWSEEILRIAPQLGKAPKELADAMFFITSAGIRGAEAMDVLKMSAKASASGLGETKIVADLVTSAMNAYGKETLNAQLATDILTASVREGKAEATALASSMGMVLPIASNMGVAFHEVGGAVAAMTRTGTSAATASMQLRQILASLLKPTQQAEEALWNMNTSSAALRKTIKQDGLLAALMQIRKLTAQYGETVMSDVFPNIRALSGALDIMGANLEDNRAIFASLEKAAGSGAKAFAAAAETFEHKWKVATATAKTALTIFGKTIAEELIPILEGFSERIREVIMWWNGLSEAQKENKIRIAGLIMVAGPLLKILGFLVASVLPKLIMIGFKAVKMFHALKLAAMANPFTALAAVLTIATVALVTFIKKSKRTAELYKGMDQWTIKATKSIIEQKVAVDQLFKVAQNENEELEKRQAALRQLNRLSPEYFDNISMETINTEAATAAKQKYIQELLREAKVKAAQEALVKLEKEAFKALEQGEAARLTFFQELKVAGMSAFLGLGRAAIVGADMATKNYQETEAQIVKTRKELETFIAGLLTVQDINEGLIGGDGGEDGTGGIAPISLAPMDFGIDEQKMLEELGLIKTFAYDKVDIMQWANDAIIQDMIEANGIIAGIEQEEMVRRHILAQSTEWYVGIVTNAFQGMSNVISDALNSTEGFLESFGVFFGNFIKGMIFKLIAATVAALALVMVISLLPGFGGAGAFKAIKEAGTFGEMMKAGIGTFMAEGGAVSGPTLAMVGEASNVSRANPEFIGTAAQLGLDRMGGGNINPSTVKFVIEQDQLVGILEMANNRKNNF